MAEGVTKRLQKELMTMTMANDPGVSAFPDGDNLRNWIGTIVGPRGTPYDGIRFKLSIAFPERYPFDPPVVKFVTPIFHPNVDEVGDICLDILNKKWTAVYNVLSVLQSIQSLLGDPNNDDPLNIRARNLWNDQNEKFLQSAVPHLMVGSSLRGAQFELRSISKVSLISISFAPDPTVTRKRSGECVSVIKMASGGQLIIRQSADVLGEFLEVAIHQLLFNRGVYPPLIFERCQKYGVPIQQSRHPELNSYISEVVSGARDCIEQKILERVVVTILNLDQRPLERYVFDCHVIEQETSLEGLVPLLREFLKKIICVDSFLPPIEEDCTFVVLIYTNIDESLDDGPAAFPKSDSWAPVEGAVDTKEFEQTKIIPLKSLSNDTIQLQLSVELEKRDNPAS